MSYKGEQTNFAKEIKLFAEQVQVLEDAAWDVYTKRTVDACVTYGLSDTLDQIGVLVGESRLGRSNSDYATAIRARIQMNSSQGEPERLIAAIKSICNTTICRYYEDYPAKVLLEIETESEPADLLNTMQKIASGGVKVTVVVTHGSPFIFSSVADPNPPDEIGLGFSSVASPTHGGKLSKLSH